MKFLAIFLLSFTCYGQLIINPYRFAGGGGGGSLTAGSDNFDRANADALGNGWVEVQGDIDIASNRASMETTGFGGMVAIKDDAPCTTVNQYIKATIHEPSGSSYPVYIFRYTDSSSPYYTVSLNTGGGNNIEWNRLASVGGASVTVQNASMAITTGNSVGVTMSGTGNSTIVRIWLNPTGVPTAVDDWNGDNTPNLTFSNDPASPVNTGLKIGIGGAQSGANADLDDFIWGDVP